MKKNNFAFEKVNYILMAISSFVIILGFVLMSGGSSTNEKFNPSIFDAMHIKIAPVICFIGFISMIVAIMYSPKNKNSKGGNAEVSSDFDSLENTKG